MPKWESVSKLEKVDKVWESVSKPNNVAKSVLKVQQVLGSVQKYEKIW